MLISTAAELRRQGKEWRNLRLYGQELNYGTSAIARMNLFLHGITDGHIAHGDTLSDPPSMTATALQSFDVVLANPPYSIKAWNRAAVRQRPLRPQHVGDAAAGPRRLRLLPAHRSASIEARTGRCAILFPHGVLFRDEEAELREELVNSTLSSASSASGRSVLQQPDGSVRLICRSTRPKGARARSCSSTQ